MFIFRNFINSIQNLKLLIVENDSIKVYDKVILLNFSVQINFLMDKI